MLFRQNDEATAFFVLLDGHIRVVKSTREGEDIIIRYINPGELLGITQALGLNNYPATAIAVLDCVVLSWPKHLWTEFAQAFPEFAANTHKTVGERLVDAHNRAIELATEQVNKRVARALVRLADQAGLKTQDGIRIGFPILRQNIAEMTGTTLHTVSRLMSIWEDQGLVRSKRREVTILDRDKLLSLVDALELEA